MAIRLEKSGGLILIRTASHDAAKQKQGTKNRRRPGAWVGLTVLAGAVLIGMHSPAWQAVSHTLKTLLAAIW